MAAGLGEEKPLLGSVHFLLFLLELRSQEEIEYFPAWNERQDFNILITNLILFNAVSIFTIYPKNIPLI